MKPLRLIMVVICCISCKHFKDPDITKQITPQAKNHTELEKVLEYYAKAPSDSLMLKAARYYIKNLEGFYYYSGKLLDQYDEYPKLIRKDRDHGEYFLRSFNSLYGSFLLSHIDKKYDINEIRADQLENNIDMAFRVWREQPWGKGISFDQFCEYILPYRIMDEIPEYDRKVIYEQFNPILDSVRKAGGSAEKACSVLNTFLKEPEWIFSLRVSFLPHSRASDLIKYHAGSCREMTDLAFFTMRSVGIPVAIDFIPQWPYRNMGHEFNVVLGRNGKVTMFLGAEDCPGTPHKPITKKGKVYRHVFGKNPLSLAMTKSNMDKVPPLFLDPRIRDVTDEYVPCHNITVPLMDCPSLPTNNKKYAYIAVFDNNKWVPVHWGNVENNKAMFTKMEGGIAYIAGYYDGARFVPASDPFILDEKGNITYLRPDKAGTNNNICISRVFPLTADAFDTWHMDGCKFQGANTADFLHATDLYTIPVKPNPFWNEINLNLNQKFRYVRYVSAGYTHLGEMEFYSSGTRLKGKPFGTRVGWYKDKTFDNALDGDINTYFDPAGRENDSSTSVGLDFGKMKKVDKIRFSAPLQEDKVEIVKGHDYELFYWDSGAWVLAAINKAKDKMVCFKNIPSKALYFVQDVTEHVNCRIFSYPDNKVAWW